MISKIPLQELRNSEFLQFSTDTLGIVSLNDPNTLQVLTQFDALTISKTELEGLFKKEQGSQITDEIVKLDALRDSLINGISAVVLGNTYHFDTTMQGYASVLEANLSIYGAGIARENYQSETAIINNILNDWSTQPDLITAVAALGLDAWVAQLEAANTSFNAKYLERTQELGAVSSDTLKSKRLETANAYYELRDFIDSYFTINKGVAPFDKVTNELNALIDQYNKLLISRKSGGDVQAPEVAK